MNFYEAENKNTEEKNPGRFFSFSCSSPVLIPFKELSLIKVAIKDYLVPFLLHTCVCSDSLFLLFCRLKKTIFHSLKLFGLSTILIQRAYWFSTLPRPHSISTKFYLLLISRGVAPIPHRGRSVVII